MKIGDTVVTKKCGPPCMGQVVGLAKYSFLEAFSGIKPSPNWQENYPEFYRGNIAYIISPSPIRGMSVEEYIEAVSPMYTPEQAEMQYKLLPASNLVLVPEDDCDVVN
jgi:hypothetical protein